MEVRPFDLRALARGLRRDVMELQQHLGRLRPAADAVALHPADPELDLDVTRRRVRALAGVGRSIRTLAAIAEELESAAADAVAADAVAADGADGQWAGLGWAPRRAPICGLPDDVLSAVDRWLTEAVGDGVSALAIETVRLAAPVVGRGRPVSGDPGGTFSTRRVPFATSAAEGAGVRGSSPAARVVVAAIDATADQTVLAHDEFGLVDHGRNRYTVVLPGVTDLSRPEPGWNPVHRSVRDLDMAAIPSSRSTGVEGNVYAATVAEALAAVGVPVGAEVQIVGHSFGADTALDLAADPGFTARYDLTHVVATGYFSQPQLRSVPAGTRVLVLQNRRDVVVGLGSGMPTSGTGVLACTPKPPAGGLDASVVRFDGGLGGLGHSIETYRRVFTAGTGLDAGDETVVGDFLDSMAPTAEPPSSMLAVDISLPRR